MGAASTKRGYSPERVDDVLAIRPSRPGAWVSGPRKLLSEDSVCALAGCKAGADDEELEHVMFTEVDDVAPLRLRLLWQSQQGNTKEPHQLQLPRQFPQYPKVMSDLEPAEDAQEAQAEVASQLQPEPEPERQWQDRQGHLQKPNQSRELHPLPLELRQLEKQLQEMQQKQDASAKQLQQMQSAKWGKLPGHHTGARGTSCHSGCFAGLPLPGLSLPGFSTGVERVRGAAATTRHVVACCAFAVGAFAHGISCVLDEMIGLGGEELEPLSRTLTRGSLSKRSLVSIAELDIEGESEDESVGESEPERESEQAATPPGGPDAEAALDVWPSEV